MTLSEEIQKSVTFDKIMALYDETDELDDYTVSMVVIQVRKIQRAQANRVAQLEAAMREAETLLTNYLVEGKFPKGSDCEEVRDMLRAALEE